MSEKEFEVILPRQGETLGHEIPFRVKGHSREEAIRKLGAKIGEDYLHAEDCRVREKK